jgi:transaldolase
MPEKTLLAFADHGRVDGLLEPDGAAAEVVLARYEAASVDLRMLARRLQVEAALAFTRSWDDLLATIDRTSSTLAAAS